MKRKCELPELLAPAGNYDSLIAAVAGGADAVYVGGEAFGARAYAKNFNMDELSRAVRYTHLHGVKLYVTVNTLVYDREMESLSDYIAELWRIGVDALITADLGVIKEIKSRTPNFPIHASTQMSVHNTYGADAAAALGCERVVLARELSSKDIKAVVEKSNAEIEVFLHGALCVSHSGQCLMSSLVGGRSGNRGECAQPCRLPYNNGKHILSLSDLSLANHVKELIDIGVASLKIEGRMKSPEYVYTVTSIYRRLLDERRGAAEKENEILRKAFSRGDFTDGYFINKKQSKMTGIRSEEDKKLSKEFFDVKLEPMRKKVFAKVRMELGKPSVMTLYNSEKSVTVTGDTPITAINSPLDAEGVKARLSKMGATMLSLDVCDIEITLDEGINLSPSQINSLRRSAAESFESCDREAVNNKYKKQKCTVESDKSFVTAQFFSQNVYNEIKNTTPEGLKLFDVIFLPLEEFSNAEGVAIPPVVFDSEIEKVEELASKARANGAIYALVGNIGAIAIAKRCALIPIGDFRLNISNSYAKEAYRELGVTECILSPELTLPMARDIGGGEIVFGRIPVMLTERCFIKENFGCDKCGRSALVDRTGKEFPIIKTFGHRNIIFNSVPTYMGDKKEEIAGAKITHKHFIFTNESAKEANRVILSYIKSQPLPYNVRRIGRRSL